MAKEMQQSKSVTLAAMHGSSPAHNWWTKAPSSVFKTMMNMLKKTYL